MQNLQLIQWIKMVAILVSAENIFIRLNLLRDIDHGFYDIEISLYRFSIQSFLIKF
jgi:hypothetical protein